MRVRPVTWDSLVEELAERIAATGPRRRLAVAVDGAAAADPDGLATALVDPLRVRGRAALQVRAADFLRPASLRLEYGRTNPDSFYDGWLDTSGLRREVLDRLAGGWVLPSLWDSAADRATRAEYVAVPERGVVLVSGTLLLGGQLRFDLAVHLWLSPAALRRQTAPADQWTLPAHQRYAAEVAPQRVADVVVRVDDPRRPAVVDAW